MSDDGYKKELFEEFHEKPRKSFPRLEKILPKADFEGKVSITLGLEKAVFISIGIILIMVIVFALGVERGRDTKIGESESTPSVASATVAQTPIIAQPAPIQTVPAVRSAPSTSGSFSKPLSAAQPKSEPEDAAAKPYTIIAMTFKERETASQAVNWLKKEGFQAYQKQDGQFFPVCIGAYANRTAAQAELSKVKHLCKDAYIKTRQ